MPSFGTKSEANLATCHPLLQRVARRVVLEFDCSCLEGHRTEDVQKVHFEAGRSQVQWPDSRHNRSPSEAVHLVPWPIDWGNTGTAAQRRKALSRFYLFGGFVLAYSKAMGIWVRWGGDWDGDLDPRDQTFDDLGHFELTHQNRGVD